MPVHDAWCSLLSLWQCCDLAHARGSTGAALRVSALLAFELLRSLAMVCVYGVSHSTCWAVGFQTH